MIHELRTYKAASTLMLQHLHDHFENRTLALFEEHDIHMKGAWEKTLGTNLPAYVYLLEWRDLGHRQASFDAFYADPRWPEIRAESKRRAGGEMATRFDLEILTPASYSPMR